MQSARGAQCSVQAGASGGTSTVVCKLLITTGHHPANVECGKASMCVPAEYQADTPSGFSSVVLVTACSCKSAECQKTMLRS